MKLNLDQMTPAAIGVLLVGAPRLLERCQRSAARNHEVAGQLQRHLQACRDAGLHAAAGTIEFAIVQLTSSAICNEHAAAQAVASTGETP